MNILNINNLHTTAQDDHNKKILNGLNLSINEGEIHVIMGPNGSGKSTLANTCFNSNKYIIKEGSISFLNEDIKDKKTDYIAKKGLFMSFQTPEEIPGITLANFLKSVNNAITGKNSFSFYKEVNEVMKKLYMNNEYLNREFNLGFSGGEKKKCEILQMLLFNPKLAILDETDSGLDVDAIKVVSKGINMFKNDSNAVLIITHSTKILEGLKVDKVHILVNGKIVKTGDINLAYEIDKEGYKKYLDEN